MESELQSPSDKSSPTQSQQEASVKLTYGGVSRPSALTTTGGGLAWRQKTGQSQKEDGTLSSPHAESRRWSKLKLTASRLVSCLGSRTSSGRLQDEFTTYSGLNSNWCYWDHRTWTSLPNNGRDQK